MPETVYVPLDGSGPRGCWRSLTSLERVLILLSVTLGVFVLALTIAIVDCKNSNGGGGNLTTIAPDTTIVPTTGMPTTGMPTTIIPTSVEPTNQPTETTTTNIQTTTVVPTGKPPNGTKTD